MFMPSAVAATGVWKISEYVMNAGRDVSTVGYRHADSGGSAIGTIDTRVFKTYTINGIYDSEISSDLTLLFGDTMPNNPDSFEAIEVSGVFSSTETRIELLRSDAVFTQPGAQTSWRWPAAMLANLFVEGNDYEVLILG